MSLPHYPVPTSQGGPAYTPTLFNQMVDVLNGFTASGTFVGAYNYTVSVNNVNGTNYYYANNAFQLIFGGPTNAGSVTGTDFAAVLQACINAGGKTLIKNGAYSLATPIVPKPASVVIGETKDGVIITWTGITSSNMIYKSSTTQIAGFELSNLTLDANNTSSVNGLVLDTIKWCRFTNLTIKNLSSGTALIIKATGGVVLPNGQSNSYSCRFEEIDILDAQYGIALYGSQASVEVTMLDFMNIRMERITSKGIAFKGWASGTQWDTVWIWLNAAGSYGVVWNDSATPTLNVGDYDNNFVNLKIDPFNAAFDASTTLLQFNCTKEDYVYGFFHSYATTFPGTVYGEISSTVSYYVTQTDASVGERAATQDAYMRVKSKGFMNGTQIFDKVIVYGDAAGTGATISLNDLYEAHDSVIYIATKSGGVNYQAKIWIPTADGQLRLLAPTGKCILLGLGDAAGATSVQVKDSTDALKAQLDSSGNIYGTGYVKCGSGSFVSHDGFQGQTFSSAVSTLTVKDGIIVGHT